MTTKDRIMEDIKQAMKSGPSADERKSVLRMLLSEIKYAQSAVNMQIELDEATVIKVISSYSKKLAKSLKDYPDGDAKNKIIREIEIVQHYLPEQASEAEVDQILSQIMSRTQSKEFSVLMREATKELELRADGQMISSVLKKKLNNN